MKVGEKYPENVRDFCFSLHYYSPRAYQYVRKIFNNNLPHKRTIRSWYANSDIRGEPGIQEAHMNRLKKIATDYKKVNGHDMICSLVFDEMNIRKQVMWSLQQLNYNGFVNYGQNPNDEEKIIAKQVIVFILNGVEVNFEFPVAYYFITTLKKLQRKQLLCDVIKAVTDCGIEISNITFDGYASNIPMCELFGINLNVFSPNFQPFLLNPITNNKIYIFVDPCHMEKCLRNALARHKIIYDDQGEKIEWRYIVSAYNYCKENSMHTNKLSKKHINWQDHKMNVRIAVETMSESVASTIEFLMKNKHPEFEGAAATVKFLRIANTMFDIFNTRHVRNENIFKRALNPNNKRIIFDYFENSIRYFKGLKVNVVRNIKPKAAKRIGGNTTRRKAVSVRTIKKIPILTSRSKTGFRGFIIDMFALMSLYEEYVEVKKLLKTVPTYFFLQDVIELYFGKIRACGGFNNNPNAIQFKGAYRKLLGNIKVTASLLSNCRIFDVDLPDNLHYSNIYFVSSKRSPISLNEETYEAQKNEILKELSVIDQFEATNHLLDISSDYSTYYIASSIEKKITEYPSFYCNGCRAVFDENDKIDVNIFSSNVVNSRPCISTVEICKAAEKFFKLYNIRKSCNRFDFKVLYCLIFRSLNFGNLFKKSEFACDIHHKYQVIKCIVGQYITRRATHTSREITFDEYNNQFHRQRLSRFILFSGQ